MTFCNDIVAPAGWLYWLFALLCVIIYAFFYLRERRIKQATAKEIAIQQSLVRLEINAFQAQLDPHFIFNSLNALHHYILTTSTEMASLYLTRFATLMRLLIGNSSKEWVNLEDDAQALELYIQLEQLRFESQFVYQLCLMPEVFHQFIHIPPLIIQPYVQEAIWQRLLLRPEKSGGKLIVTIGKEGEMLLIQIQDNGVPYRNTPAAETALSRSIAIAAKRLHILNRKYNTRAAVTRAPDYDEDGRPCGNRVTITVQFLHGSLLAC